MAAAEKFTFGQDFGKTGKAPMTPSSGERTRVENEARVRAEGFAEGLAEGRRQAHAEFDHRMMLALEATAARAGALVNDLDRIGDDLTDEVVGFALKFAEAVAGVAVKRFPAASLEAAARDMFGQLRRAPHCVVRIHESLVEQANEILTRAARERGFEGKLVVMGESDMAAGDFTLEWADGGVRRDGAALRQRLIETIERHAPRATSDRSES
jgi:flagellar assembly protein FliH